jgi:hypothetical protein
MRHRGVRFGFVLPFDWVEARDPGQLEDAVRQKLLEDSRSKQKN